MNMQDKIELILSRYLIIMGGKYGQGKSLSMTALIYFFIMAQQRNKILTNMPIRFKMFDENINLTPLISTKQFDEIENNSLIVWDEMYIDLFNRNSNSVKNKYVSIFSRDIRKINGRIIGSVQFFDMLEKNMNLILEIIIIPKYIKKYSMDRKKDMIERLKNKDFWIDWLVIDKVEDSEFHIKLNLYPFLDCYDTNFKPSALFLDHSEYIDKLVKKKREYELFNDIKDSELELRAEYFLDCLENVTGELNV